MTVPPRPDSHPLPAAAAAAAALCRRPRAGEVSSASCRGHTRAAARCLPGQRLPRAASWRLVQRRGTRRPPRAAARDGQREAGRVPLRVLPAGPEENEWEIQVSSKRQCF